MHRKFEKLLGHLPWRTVLGVLHGCRGLLGANLESLILDLANPGRHWFLPPDVPVQDFFDRLEERQIRYVVLRWFEELPRLDRKHDLDLLVADRSLEPMLSELSHWPIGHPVDVYSETGVDGTAYALQGDAPGPPLRIPIFPLDIARGILERRVRHGDCCYVPNPEDHFCALAYHAVFLKGAKSGIPSSDSCHEELAPATHDYAAALRKLGARVDVDLSGEVTRARVAAILAERGWKPLAPDS